MFLVGSFKFEESTFFFGKFFTAVKFKLAQSI